MGQETTPINPVRFYRQDSEPPAAPDGATWITESDGAGGDTTSRYIRNGTAGRWELESSVGPSEPTLGVPVPGSTWRDTANANAKQYDGAAFVNLGVTDHANLTNVTSGQHHTRPNFELNIAQITANEAFDMSPGTTYTNNLGPSMTMITVRSTASTSNFGLRMEVNDNRVADIDMNMIGGSFDELTESSTSVMIPAGATYSYSLSGDAELSIFRRAEMEVREV
jgi:hypothetical protein